MANKRLQRTLKRFLSKMKNSKPQVQLSLNNSMIMSKSFILSGCKHTKTQSFSRGGGVSCKSNNPRDEEAAAAQLEDIDKFLYENFRSLYLRDADVDNNHHHSVSSNNRHDDDDDDGKEARKKGKERMIVFDDSPMSVKRSDVPEFTRLYLGGGSSSSSLVDEGFRSSLTVSEEITETTTLPSNVDIDSIEDHNCKEGSSSAPTKLLEGSIAVMRYSSSPYDDFKKSMQEMVDSRKSNHDGRIDWEFMEQILFYFIKLNDKKSYKYLLNAFVDIIITLRGEATPPSSVGMSVRRKNR